MLISKMFRFFLGICFMLSAFVFTVNAQEEKKENPASNKDTANAQIYVTDSLVSTDKNTATTITPSISQNNSPTNNDALVVSTEESTKTSTVPEAIDVSSSNQPSAQQLDVQDIEALSKNISGEKKSILIGSWTKNIIFSTDNGSFKFQPTGFLQPKFLIKFNPDSQSNNDEPLDGSGFSIARAQLGIEAWLSKWGYISLSGKFNLKEAGLYNGYISVGPNNGKGTAGISIGLFKPFFVRQSLNSEAKLAMIDYSRAWTELDFRVEQPSVGEYKYIYKPLNEHQLGIAFHGFAANFIEYSVGLWNGEDGFATDADFMYGGRLAVHPMGPSVNSTLLPGDESDTALSTKPGLSIGAAASLEERNDATTDLPGLLAYDDYKLKFGCDIALKYLGLSLTAEYFIVKIWAKERSIHEALQRYHRDAPGMGAYFQFAYLVVPKMLEVAGRFDMADENIDIRGIRFYPTIGVTYFVFGHNLKAQFQYRANIGAGYKENYDMGFIPLSHDFLFMIQGYI